MKRLAIFVLIASLLLTLPLMAQRRGPRVLVVDSGFDFGYVPQSGKVSHTYWVDNLGTDTLRIFNIQPGCGCTKAPLTTFHAAPNDSLPIELVFDSGNRHRDQHKSTAVSCNDPAMSLFRLALTAWVYKDGEPSGPLTITKNALLKLTTDDLGKSYEVEFKNDSEEPVTTTLVDYPHELVSVQMPQGKIDPGDKGTIRVLVNKKIKQANYNKSFTFELADSANTRYSIPVRMSEPVSSM